jgi:hypothetical protein
MFSLMWLCVPYIRKWFYPIYLTSVEAEIAYWLELKSFFNSVNITSNTFSSELVLLATEKQGKSKQVRVKLEWFVFKTSWFSE